MHVRVHDSIDDIPASDWNALLGDDYPFLKHEFLSSGERSGSVSPESGWIARHLALYRNDRLAAAMPLYEKSHSWGEFVFDWAWARAYEQAGLRYYPKLVSAVPFTPAPSRRILLKDRDDNEASRTLLAATIELSKDTGCSSLHVQFPLEDELTAFRDAGFKIRKDCQFHWNNHNYQDFNEFLQTFNARKRKKARQDRRRVEEAGITFRRLHGDEMSDEQWETVYRLISITFMRRGSLPYYNLDFFIDLSKRLPHNVMVIQAELQQSVVAAAVFFVSGDRLYGRYWGSNSHHNALHFETCYYQGIEYCIEAGIECFEPGTQGEHKISRGFVPTSTWSAHWLAQPEFLDAVGDYVDEEARHIDRYMDTVDAHSPYRKK